MKLSDAEVTPWTPSYGHVVLIIACGTVMLMPFSRAHAGFSREREGFARGAPGAEDSTRQR